MSYIDDFRELGYAIVRGAFDAPTIARLAAEFDRIAGLAERGQLAGDVHCFFSEHPTHGRVVRFVQRAGYVDAAARAWCASPVLPELLQPLIGGDLKIVRNSFFYKPPGSSDDHIGYHQDWRFRQPAAAFRDHGTAYVQLGVAVDRHGPENGGMRVVARSHRRGDAGLCPTGGVSRTPASEDALRAAGLDPRGIVPFELEPGDVALWTPYTVHGSTPNPSARPRRFFVCGFARASSVDVGERAFGPPAARAGLKGVA
jgi:ectoine hydroxylase-related dioxygenase (phytanoyl-CoA dioxygenase family)